MTTQRDELIVQITKVIYNMTFLETATIKEKVAIGRHIANMPRKSRIMFVNALISAVQKSREYDIMQHAADSRYCTFKNVEFAVNPEWNK